MEKIEIVKFTIPMLPISMNSIYGITSGRGGVKVFLKSEARQFKEKAKLFMPPKTLPSPALLGLEIKAQGQWFHKNGNVKKLDIQNLEKILIDAIAEKYGFEDSRIFHKVCEKVKAEKEELKIGLFELTAV